MNSQHTRNQRTWLVLPLFTIVPQNVTDAGITLTRNAPEDPDQLIGDNLVFPGCSMKEFMARPAGLLLRRAHHNRRLGFSQKLGACCWSQRNFRCVPGNLHMRNVIRDVGNEKCRADARHFHDLPGN